MSWFLVAQACRRLGADVLTSAPTSPAACQKVVATLGRRRVVFVRCGGDGFFATVLVAGPEPDGWAELRSVTLLTEAMLGLMGCGTGGDTAAGHINLILRASPAGDAGILAHVWTPRSRREVLIPPTLFPLAVAVCQGEMPLAVFAEALLDAGLVEELP